MNCKRYATFPQAKDDWLRLQQTSAHSPFQSYWYNRIFAESFCDTDTVHIISVENDGKIVAIGAFEIVNNTVLLLGMKPVIENEEISDFGDIIMDNTSSDGQAIWRCIIDYFAKLDFDFLQLDYIQEDSKTFQALSTNDNRAKNVQEVSPYIVLPTTWDEYLTKLDKKDRHELKRKIKRLENQTQFTVCTDTTIKQEFDEFVKLHRLSDGNKQKFMSDKMKDFFWKLIEAEKSDWQMHICSLTVDGKYAASVCIFTNTDSFLLYNSGLDPEYRYFSVGLVFHAFLIRKAITEGKKIYSFLRGNERYKYDLGAQDINLYQFKLPLK